MILIGANADHSRWRVADAHRERAKDERHHVRSDREMSSDPGRAITAAPGEPGSNRKGMVSAERSCQTSGGFASSTELAGYGLARRLPLAQRSVLAGKVALLEGRLFDEDGRLRRDLGGEVAGTLLGEINDLR